MDENTLRYKAYKGASLRLQGALDIAGFPKVRDGRNTYFAEQFSLSLTSAQRMLTQDSVPSKGDSIDVICARLGISASYWVYGLDEYCGEVFASLSAKAWEAMLRQLKADGRSIDAAPVGLLLQLAGVIYRHILQNGHEVDLDYVSQILSIAFDLREEVEVER